MIIQATVHEDVRNDSNDPRRVTRTQMYDNAYDVQISKDPAVFDFNAPDYAPWSTECAHVLSGGETGRCEISWAQWYDNNGSHVLISTGVIYVLNDEGKTIARTGTPRPSKVRS